MTPLEGKKFPYLNLNSEGIYRQRLRKNQSDSWLYIFLPADLLAPLYLLSYVSIYLCNGKFIKCISFFPIQLNGDTALKDSRSEPDCAAGLNEQRLLYVPDSSGCHSRTSPDRSGGLPASPAGNYYQPPSQRRQKLARSQVRDSRMKLVLLTGTKNAILEIDIKLLRNCGLVGIARFQLLV